MSSFFPSLLPSKACVTAEVCSLLLLFQPSGYLNPGQPYFLSPYLHRSSPSLLNSSFIFSLFDSIKSIYIIPTDSLITLLLGYNLLVNLSSSPREKKEGMTEVKKEGKKAVVDRWMRSSWGGVATDKQHQTSAGDCDCGPPCFKDILSA